jgi:hypothetical protein
MTWFGRLTMTGAFIYDALRQAQGGELVEPPFLYKKHLSP